MRQRLVVVAALGAVLGGSVAAAWAADIVVYDTGVDDDGLVVSPDFAPSDAHWTIVSAPPGTGSLPAPAKVAYAHPGYALQNDAPGSTGSSWIALGGDTNGFYPLGEYVFRTTFDLTGLDPGTAALTVQLAADDVVVDVLINGTSLGYEYGGFHAFGPTLNVASGFQDGENTLDFVLLNLGNFPNPSGLHVRISGTADEAVPDDTTAPVISGADDVAFEYEGAAVALDAASLGITAEDETDGAVDVVLDVDEADLGTTTVTATATDAAGNVATATFDVVVADTTAPTISAISVSPDSLDCNSHEMVEVTVSVTVTDAGDASPTVKIVDVASDEEVEGKRCGKTSPDWEITGDLTADLRAERNGKGDGRTYTLTVEATDASGNSSTATVTVEVPRESRKKRDCDRDDDRDDRDGKGKGKDKDRDDDRGHGKDRDGDGKGKDKRR